MHWPLDTEAPGTGHFSLRIMGEPALCYTDVQGGKTLCLLAKMKGCYYELRIPGKHLASTPGDRFRLLTLD